MELCHFTLLDWLKRRNSTLLAKPPSTGLDNDIDRAIQRRAPWERLNKSEIRWLFDQTVQAVDYMHGQGVLHRDLKVTI